MVCKKTYVDTLTVKGLLGSITLYPLKTLCNKNYQYGKRHKTKIIGVSKERAAKIHISLLHVTIEILV